MPILSHPPQGCVVTVDYGQGFKVPEMTKKRLAIVLSPNIRARVSLVTIVPLSLTAPANILPFHCQFEVPFELPCEWGQSSRWIKGDMINAVGFHRVDLLRLGKTENGKRKYQMQVISGAQMKDVRRCVLHGLGLSNLTKHL
jgi:mRNA interferase MazF